VLRNLADVNGSRDLFLKKNILPELVSILKIFKTDSDVVMNICRILRYMVCMRVLYSLKSRECKSSFLAARS
jgi:hypothetical protein